MWRSLLVTCLRGELPLSAEAIRKFGPKHIPIASKGYENLFVALANHKRVDAPYAVLKVTLGVLQKWNI